MRAYLVRHGQSGHNAGEGSLSFDDGDQLTELGWEQARAVGRSLRDAGVTEVISSTMRRARQTAEAIAGEIGFDPGAIEIEDGIQELHEGDDYLGLDSDARELRRWSVRMSQYADDPDHSFGPGGESFNDLRARVRSFSERLAARETGGLPLVVTHGIFLRFFLMDNLLRDAFVPSMIHRLWHLRSVNCGVSVFEHSEVYPVSDPPPQDWVCASWMSKPWTCP